MRLLFIVENDEPHASGGGFYALFKFAEFLALKGHSVLIYAVHDLGWVKANGNLSLYFRPRLPRRGKWLVRLDRILSRMGERLILPYTIRRFQPDWILGVLTYSAIKAEALGRKFRIPVANFIYECPPWMREVLGEDAYTQGHDAFSLRLWESTRQAYLGSRLLFPNSSLSRDYNRAWLGGKAVAEPIHPGIDPAQMPVEAPENEPMGLRSGPGQLLYVGRLVKSKNVGDLISACLRLDTDWELHICGSGPELENLKAIAAGSPSVRFHGFVPDAVLWSLFRQCDLVVYPTAFEGFGMPPMQALYFGKACLVSDLAILRGIFGNRLEYFPLGDVGALAASISGLLADGPYRRRRGAAGRQFILEHFTWARAADQLDHSLAAALAGPALAAMQPC